MTNEEPGTLGISAYVYNHPEEYERFGQALQKFFGKAKVATFGKNAQSYRTIFRIFHINMRNWCTFRLTGVILIANVDCAPVGLSIVQYDARFILTEVLNRVLAS